MDHSLFAWDDIDPAHRTSSRRGLLARSPIDFRNSGKIVPYRTMHRKVPDSISNKGLAMELPLLPGRLKSVALLDCHHENDVSGCIGVELTENEFGILKRQPSSKLQTVRYVEYAKAVRQSFFGLRDADSIREEASASVKCHFLVRHHQPRGESEFVLKHADCWKGVEHLWSGKNLVLNLGYHATSDNSPHVAGFFFSHSPTSQRLVILLIFYISVSSVFSSSRHVSPVGVMVLPQPADSSPKSLLEEWEIYLGSLALGDLRHVWEKHLNEWDMKRCELDERYLSELHEVRVELNEEEILGETIWVIDLLKIRSKGHRWCREHNPGDSGRLCSHFQVRKRRPFESLQCRKWSFRRKSSRRSVPKLAEELYGSDASIVSSGNEGENLSGDALDQDGLDQGGLGG